MLEAVGGGSTFARDIILPAEGPRHVLDLNAHLTFDGPVVGGAAFSVCAFVYIRAFDGYPCLLDIASQDGRHRIALCAGRKGAIIWAVGDSDIEQDGFFTWNTWTHVCAAVSDSSMAVHRNGQLFAGCIERCGRGQLLKHDTMAPLCHFGLGSFLQPRVLGAKHVHVSNTKKE